MINQEEIQSFGNLDLIAKQVVEGFITGLHKSPFHGFSVEFAEHRIYNTGESTRYIDWKLYARTDKLFIKRFEEETNLRCHIILDNSSSMYYPDVENNKMKFSVYAAAALIHLLKKQRDAYGMSVFSNDVKFHAEARSSIMQQKMLYNELEKLLMLKSDHQTTSVATALHTIAESIHKRSMVVIFSDMMSSEDDSESLFSALQHLKYNKHEVILFHVTDKNTELDFDFQQRPYEFIDVESGERIKVNPDNIREQYLTAIRSHREQLMDRCAQFHIDMVDADIRSGFAQVLMPYLVKRDAMIK